MSGGAGNNLAEAGDMRQLGGRRGRLHPCRFGAQQGDDAAEGQQVEKGEGEN
jgi:hypothetical protein